MQDPGFHFASPLWFFALLAWFPVLYWLRKTHTRGATGAVHRYADAHLLPYLTGVQVLRAVKHRRPFFWWALVWSLLVIAMAGPRWGYTDLILMRPQHHIVVVLDISRSMQVADVPPSRLARAKQEIQDLLSQGQPVNVGLVAFASVASVITPVTQDAQTLLNALPALQTELLMMQGSRLHDALDKAAILLRQLPEDQGKFILLLSDGDFDEKDLPAHVAELQAAGIRFFALGMGTTGGGPVPAEQGRWMMSRDGRTIESRLNAELLQTLAQAGNGQYLEASFLDDDSQALLAAMTQAPQRRSGEEDAQHKARIWSERYPWFLLPAVLLFVGQFRRNPGGERS